MLKLRTIGVTGGIGSGKSTVSKILADLGAQIMMLMLLQEMLS